MAASLCGVLRAFFRGLFELAQRNENLRPARGDGLNLLGQHDRSLLAVSWAQSAHSAPAPLPVGETGGSKCQGEPGGGGSPARQGRSLEAGLHKRMGRPAMVHRLRTARKTGETARVGAGISSIRRQSSQWK